MLIRHLVIANPTGLHARPASIIAAEAARFKSHIMLHCNDKTVSAKSAVALLSLGVQPGQQVTIMIEGEDQQEAMEFLGELFTKTIVNL